MKLKSERDVQTRRKVIFYFCTTIDKTLETIRTENAAAIMEANFARAGFAAHQIK
jgi:hypothetical protein